LVFQRLKEVFLKNKDLEIVLCRWSPSSPCVDPPSLENHGASILNSWTCFGSSIAFLDCSIV